MKVVWALGGTVGIRNPKHFHAIDNGLNAPGRFFDHWGTPILAGLAIVILLGLVCTWGDRAILRPLLRTLGWAGSLMAVVGVVGLELIIRYYAAGDHGIGRGDLYAGSHLFTYICFTMLGVGVAGTGATSRGTTPSSWAARCTLATGSRARASSLPSTQATWRPGRPGCSAADRPAIRRAQLRTRPSRSTRSSQQLRRVSTGCSPASSTATS